MPINPDTLSSFAGEYAKEMTSIRGRRVQRLLRREFADVDYVLWVKVGSGEPAALGLSATGAALCATDGKGRQASVVTWSHGSTEALETYFDLYKDSLPVLISSSVPLASLRARWALSLPAGVVPLQARPLAAKVLEVLG